jgi:DNA-binding ferritin-like protein (Dps family)
MIHQEKKDFIEKKKNRRERKRADKRSTTADEVIFIFEKTLEHWKTIKIFNAIIQTNPNSQTNKKSVEQIVTGNCKVYASELSKERYIYYQELRDKVYEYKKQV